MRSDAVTPLLDGREEEDSPAKRRRPPRGCWVTVRRAVRTFVRRRWLLCAVSAVLVAGLVVLRFTSWQQLPAKGWVTVSTIVALLIGLAGEFARPAVAFVAAFLVLLLAKVLPLAVALEGFAEPLVYAVAALSAVSAGIQESTLLAYFVGVLGTPKTTRGALLRLLPASALFSIFLSNTAIVQMLMPAVLQWGSQTGIPPSKLLMPLSFSVILGGTGSQLGSSINLIVAGLASAVTSSNHSLAFDISFFRCVWWCSSVWVLWRSGVWCLLPCH